ncbi:hypothetical protein DXA27_02395 [Bacteroides fragilis]|uniref:Uncharacterized protein n=1 Tax=Bacteroides fragilis TaxID=817 RepID=A0A413K4R2_BACFG|nr:hypothetical protein DXA27_02395 [Bacteroides fragilis]
MTGKAERPEEEVVSEPFSPRSNTEYHRVFLLIINNFKSPLCYSVSSVVGFDTHSSSAYFS